jgi:superfamily II DNA or RNA helicase
MMKGTLTHKGFKICKSDITQEELKTLKKKLTVKPIVLPDYDFNNTPFPVYKHNKNYIYIPKFYALNTFGKVILNNNNEERNGQTISLEFNGSLKKLQKPIVNNLLTHMNENDSGVLSVMPGFGKCLAYDTKILMYDGLIKKVQDIKVGDKLMGDDSKPRNVLSLARGQEEMFEIKPRNGESYSVNKSHILSLRHGGDNTIIDISVEDYLKKSPFFKSSFKTYKVPIDFRHKNVPIDPYLIGFWLGGGNSCSPVITNQDAAVLNYLTNKLPEYNNYLHPTQNNYAYRINTTDLKGNYFWYTIKSLNLHNNKHIPDIYKINSREVRLGVLAGLLDSNGTKGGGYEFTQKNEKLMEDFIYLVNSLGFMRLRTSVFGEGIENIPCLIKRKQAIKNSLNYGFEIISKGVGDYYGFEIDGNRRFVLGTFYVTHNTVCALNIISKINKKTLIVVHKKFLMNQWIDRIKQFLPNARVGIIRQNTVDIENKDIVIGMLQSISMKEYPKETFDSMGLLVIDECLSRKQLVITEDGPKKIGDLYNLWKNSKELPNVLSYNKEFNIFEYKQITYAWEKQKKELLNIKYGTGSIDCTDNHLILTPNGYKEAGKLKIGDLIKCKIECNKTGTVKIKDIKPILNEGRGYNGKVYDIEVSDNHNFVLASIINNSGPIVHNCHHVCAKTFSKALHKIATKKSLGLSATPHRKDGLTKILNWFLGDIISPKVVQNINLVPTIKFVQAKYFKGEKPKIQLNMRGKINLPNLITTISLDIVRNNLIIDEVVKHVSQNRKILILSDRRQHCIELGKELEKSHNILYGLYLGGMKEDMLKISNTKQVILATYTMASEGYDNPSLDTLILATSRGNIEQSIGRILRKVNQNKPLVIDFVDNVEGMYGQLNKRKKFYKSKNYKIPKDPTEKKEKMNKYAFIDD